MNIKTDVKSEIVKGMFFKKQKEWINLLDNSIHKNLLFKINYKNNEVFNFTIIY